jgi:hypothetical protein
MTIKEPKFATVLATRTNYERYPTHIISLVANGESGAKIAVKKQQMVLIKVPAIAINLLGAKAPTRSPATDPTFATAPKAVIDVA